ncbi:MAG: tetratricopeptide repeat protein [Bacteroidota bacterium]
MKKVVLVIVAICFYSSGISQEKKISSDKLLKESAENGCKCIDSIPTYNNPKETVIAEINKCISKQTVSYQLTSKLMQIDILKENATDKNISIAVNTNENSDEYKKYYYELERYMMDNCTSLKSKIASNEKQAQNSFSQNPKAKEFYYKGLDEFEKEKYEKAIEYFKKALKEDAEFAFAWDNIGLSYRKLGNYDKAIESYNKSLEIEPEGTMPLQNIAIAYQYKKEYQKAIDSFQKLAKINKNDPEIYFGIGNVYAINLRDFEKGLDNMCKAYTIYVEQKSAYRADAEKIINYIHSELKAQGKEARYYEILKSYNISE